LGCHDLLGAPLLVVANKQDAEGAAGLSDVADAFGLGKLDSRPVIVQPASAHSGQGLADGLKWLVEAVKRSPRRRLVTSRR
jgi:signal recognition particle receptor subunit beta